MEPVTIKELWMLLGEKDVQIFQLLKTIEEMEKKLPPPPPTGKSAPTKGL